MAKVFTITEGLENMGALKTGGQGSVYKGRRIGEIFTAIKILPTPIYNESVEDKNFASFQNEVQKLKRVNEAPNPNVVKIISWGVTDSGNFPFIEMEFIEGPDLEELLQPPHDPVFSIKEVLKVADHLSNALAHCHKAGVRHGDIKSNNVKFNTRTGNYILLDFGLSVMSDEERRTSLRRAGAIEFMAPEQNEGQMLFQTDVYSFGVILFELLAGTVPFPLKDKGETARNTVMLSHMETPPPDLLQLRQKAIPQSWNTERREHEMQIPQWLIDTIYKCLEKKPNSRFASGIELHNYIWQNSIRTVSKLEGVEEHVKILQQENAKLLHEKELLIQQLLHHSGGSKGSSGSQNIAHTPHAPSGESATRHASKATDTSLLSRKNLTLAVVVVITIIVLVYALTKLGNNDKKKDTTVVNQPQSNTKVIGQYRVIAARAYFYNEPREGTQRSAFAVPGNYAIKAYDEKNSFIYTSITNEKGQVSKGWLRKEDLITWADWIKMRDTATRTNQLAERDVRIQLNEAKQFLNTGRLPEALATYKNLAAQKVPEAMYQYAKMALQNKNEGLNCSDAFDMLANSAEKNYAPAKTTLGILYIYADNDEVLQRNNYYERCEFTKNLSRGSQLLISAMLQGDTTAARILDQLNMKGQ